MEIFFVSNMGIITILIFIVSAKVIGASDFDPRNHTNWKLLRHDICGQSTSDRIVGGKEVSLGAHPWATRLSYIVADEPVFHCGGVVASSKIILTAAHCVTNLTNKIGIIRLGEHNTETNPDCIGDFCADPVVDIPPSEIIIPKNYDAKLKNDIALIRLAKEIKFSDFIKPICFASGSLLEKDFVGSMGEVVGWGVTNVKEQSLSNKLLSVKIPVMQENECLKRIPYRLGFGSSQMCAGGLLGSDSCSGDSGGGMVKVEDSDAGPRYFLIGIVSYGPENCGKSKIPGVYTKMSSYLKWFLDNMEQTTDDSVKVF